MKQVVSGVYNFTGLMVGRVYLGDTIFRLPNIRLPFSFLTVDMAENLRSIKKVAGLEAEVVCFGHGNPLVENTAATIRRFAQKVGAL